MAGHERRLSDAFNFDAASPTISTDDQPIALATEAPPAAGGNTTLDGGGSATTSSAVPLPALRPAAAASSSSSYAAKPSSSAASDSKSAPAAAFPSLAYDSKAAPAGSSGTASALSTSASSSSVKGAGSAGAGAGVGFQQRKALGENVVEIKNLKKSYKLEGRADVVQALRNVNLTASSECYPIRRGEFVMIRGPSGGGKTTLLNIIGTIDEPSSGALSIFGSVVDAQSTDAYLSGLRLNKIGFVFQTFNLLATLSAYENVLLPMTIAGRKSAKDARARALQLLGLVGLSDRMSHLPSELSGGEQQRVTIARALANEPELLLLDEPTGDLDTRNTIEVMDLLLSINVTKQTTCVMVTHNPDLECYADRILYVQDGAFQRQVLNEVQSRLDFDAYMKHLSEETAVPQLPPPLGPQATLQNQILPVTHPHPNPNANPTAAALAKTDL